MIYNNILDAIGHTPLIQLQRIVTPDMARVLVKFEGLNVGGSIKTRTAYNMILEAEKEGCIVIDNSSAFRNDDDIPLIVSEINMHDFYNSKRKIIANPIVFINIIFN